MDNSITVAETVREHEDYLAACETSGLTDSEFHENTPNLILHTHPSPRRSSDTKRHAFGAPQRISRAVDPGLDFFLSSSMYAWRFRMHLLVRGSCRHQKISRLLNSWSMPS
ncbi:hypothetical protein A0H81_03411 [Grifola frondosa]|uniref:Uncharacterized protein n=1 Tax=Grifola frondosa TaxID=5627 RepID=A0A1C7MIY4_GRIFR|nr:hypothetical protein A0H81_03411 [Grifola frondosa]